MADYVIMTDSGTDIDPRVLKEWGVECSNLTFYFEDGVEHSNTDMEPAEFYRRMRAGEVSKTAAVNIETFKNMFEPALKEGLDLLYIGFSSGISNTSNAGIMAARELQEQYPERTIIAIDTLCASAGQGLMVYMAVEQKKAGKSIEEVGKFVEDNIDKIGEWFTVDDLKYLVRGGRVSPAAAFAAGVLGIKPVLRVDEEGKLASMSKVRGRAQSIKALAKKYSEKALDPENGPYFISHGDCLDDVKALEALIVEAHGNKCSLITDVGPVIGSHSGPGTLALFFPAKDRQ